LIEIRGGHNRIVEDFVQVSASKLAVMYRSKVCVYGIGDGTELFCREIQKLDKIFAIANRYLLVCFDSGANRLSRPQISVIDTNDYSGFDLIVEEKVNSAIYLDSGSLILGESSLTCWSTWETPFTKIASQSSSYRNYVALSGNLFAYSFGGSVFVSNTHLQVLHVFADLTMMYNSKQIKE